MTKVIIGRRESLNLTFIDGCVPPKHYVSCKPFGKEGTLVQSITAATVVDLDHPANLLTTIANQGATRWDLVQGSFARTRPPSDLSLVILTRWDVKSMTT